MITAEQQPLKWVRQSNMQIHGTNAQNTHIKLKKASKTLGILVTLLVYGGREGNDRGIHVKISIVDYLRGVGLGGTFPTQFIVYFCNKCFLSLLLYLEKTKFKVYIYVPFLILSSSFQLICSSTCITNSSNSETGCQLFVCALTE